MKDTVSDVADALKRRLESAQAEGLVESIGSARKTRAKTTTPTPEPEKPNPLEGMDLQLLSRMIWDTFAGIRGYDAAGVPVDEGSKAKWAEALAPVLEKLIGEFLAEYHEEATLIIVTLLIVLPRESIMFKQRRAKASIESSTDTDNGERDAPSIGIR